jgi:hypothetical protein
MPVALFFGVVEQYLTALGNGRHSEEKAAASTGAALPARYVR